VFKIWYDGHQKEDPSNPNKGRKEVKMEDNKLFISASVPAIEKLAKSLGLNNVRPYVDFLRIILSFNVDGCCGVQYDESSDEISVWTSVEFMNDIVMNSTDSTAMRAVAVEMRKKALGLTSVSGIEVVLEDLAEVFGTEGAEPDSAAADSDETPDPIKERYKDVPVDPDRYGKPIDDWPGYYHIDLPAYNEAGERVVERRVYGPRPLCDNRTWQLEIPV